MKIHVLVIFPKNKIDFLSFFFRKSTVKVIFDELFDLFVNPSLLGIGFKLKIIDRFSFITAYLKFKSEHWKAADLFWK